MSSAYCSLCRSRSTGSFVSVPRDENRRALWSTATDLTLTPSNRLCAKHFAECDFYFHSCKNGTKRRRLKKNAVPKKMDSLNESLTCGENEFDVSSQTDFPTNPDTLKKWLAFCRKNNIDKLKPYQKSVICNDIQGGLQFQMGLCSEPGAVPCINKNDMSEAEREKSEKSKNQKLAAELLEEAEAREAAEDSGAITITHDFVRNTGIVSVPDFVSATGNAFVPFTQKAEPTEIDPLAEEQVEIDKVIKSTTADEHHKKQRCRTCSRSFVVDEKSKDLGNEENAVMLYHIEVITGIWISCKDEIARFMCSTCVDNLRTAIEFRETCIQTELQFAGGGDDEQSDDIKVNDIEFKDRDEQSLVDDIKEEEFISDGENEQTTVESLSRAMNKNTGHILHTGPVDSNGLALGVQIYEDLLNEYLGKEKLPRQKVTASKKVAASQTLKTQVIKPQKQDRKPRDRKPRDRKSRDSKPREPAAKRTTKSREEKNRLRRERIRALPLNHVCDQCGASFRFRHNLTIHMQRHSRTKNYTCPECPEEFYDGYSRNMHIRVRHRGERPFACNYCKKAFSSSNTRYLHEKNVHGASPRIHRNIINPKLKLKAENQNENKPPKEIVRHECMYCDKSYISKYVLNGHINEHLGINPFKCKVCNMSFPHPKAKKKHMIRHDIKSPFECDICLKGFYSRSTLKDHERTHTGERPYRCDICDAFFRYKYNLQSHQFSKMHKDNVQKAQKDTIIEDSS